MRIFGNVTPLFLLIFPHLVLLFGVGREGRPTLMSVEIPGGKKYFARRTCDIRETSTAGKRLPETFLDKNGRKAEVSSFYFH